MSARIALCYGLTVSIVAVYVIDVARIGQYAINHVQKCNVLNCHTRDGGYTEERGNV